jgi:molybdopterin-containing oxidoreductase family iron-sulfur binding subunit
MEKCSYCVQRIKKVTIAADREQRSVIDGEIRTACQQVCPSEAITFGDLNDEASAAARQRAEPRNYGILEDLNTRPRTTYMAKITNPNPVLSPADDDHGEQHG